MSSPHDGNFDQQGRTGPNDGSNVPPMSAEPITTYLPTWQPDPVRQKRADFTIEDILDLPDHAPRVELVHGRMFPLTPPQFRHQRVAYRICRWLEDHAPANRYVVAPGLGVAISVTHSREPDVVLLDDWATPEHHFFSPDEITLAVEVASPSTQRTDRLEKPAEYAAAGIQHYWRVELDPVVHIYAYRLVRRGVHHLVADSAEVLELDEPFPIKLPISEITW
jgi:Uma2 family endonuclease